MSKSILQQSRILIVDDEKANVRFLEMILEDAGYKNIFSTTDSRQTLRLFQEIHPDLVLLDLTMPHMDGFEVMQQLHVEMAGHTVQILVLTADSTATAKHNA
ncbi:MAG: response regulator, partial [Cytophagaceae bacterium]